MNVHTPLSFSLMCLRFIPTFPVRWADICSSFCFHPLTSGTFKIPFGTFWNPSSRGNLARISIRRFVARYGLSQSICRQTFCFVLKNVGQTGVQGHPGKWAYIQIPGVDHFVCQTLHSRKLHRFILHLLRLFSGIRSLRLTLKTFFFFSRIHLVRADSIIYAEMASTLKPEQCHRWPRPPPPAENGSVSRALPG